jgi:hypothetical protein
MAVEKLSFQKTAEIRARQHALQTIRRDRLDIFYPQICADFLRSRVFQQPQAKSLTEPGRYPAPCSHPILLLDP